MFIVPDLHQPNSFFVDKETAKELRTNPETKIIANDRHHPGNLLVDAKTIEILRMNQTHTPEASVGATQEKPLTAPKIAESESKSESKSITTNKFQIQQVSGGRLEFVGQGVLRPVIKAHTAKVPGETALESPEMKF